MPRVRNVRPTVVYWLFDTRPEITAKHPKGYPFYCGKTVMRPEQRLCSHFIAARKHPDRPISKRLNECGKHVRIEVMATAPACESWTEQERAWIELEKHWIHTLRLLWSGSVNVSEGGSGASGVVRSVEFRRKLSEAHKGTKRGPMSAEARAKMSASRTGRKRKPFSDEHRAKLSATAKNRSPELRAAIGERSRGTKLSPERKAALLASVLGKKRGPYSAEHRAKISESQRARFARMRDGPNANPN